MVPNCYWRNLAYGLTIDTLAYGLTIDTSSTKNNKFLINLQIDGLCMKTCDEDPCWRWAMRFSQ